MLMGMLDSWGAPKALEPRTGMFSSRVCKQVLILNLGHIVQGHS